MFTGVLTSFTLPFALLYFVQLLTHHPEGPSGFARILFQTFFQAGNSATQLASSACSLACCDKVINSTIKQEHFPDATGGTPWLLQLNSCPFRRWLCGLFFKLFPTTWESAYIFPSPLDSCTAQWHWSTAITNLYTSLPCRGITL